MKFLQKLFGKQKPEAKSLIIDLTKFDDEVIPKVEIEKENSWKHPLTYRLQNDFSKYLRGHRHSGYDAVQLGQLVLKVSEEYMGECSTEYKLYFKDILVFTGEYEANEEDHYIYTGKWHHRGKWETDIFDEIDIFIFARESERKSKEDEQSAEIEQKLNQYV